MNWGKTILSIYDHSGVWSGEYERAGYNVVRVDIQDGQDARLLKYIKDVHGIILQPPCDHMAASGARWWEEKGDAALLEGLALVDAGLRAVALHSPSLEWWVLENPIGRLKDYLGPPRHIIHPWQFCGYTEEDDNYTKATCLWGNFRMPPNMPGPEPHDNKRIHHEAPGPERKNNRSRTPTGWARAFFEANR